MRTFFTLVILLALGAGGAWYMAGRQPGPTIEIVQPAVIGQTGTLSVNLDSPNGKLQSIDIALEQGGKRIPVFTADAEGAAKLPREGETRVRVTRSMGKQTFPELQAGGARVVVTAVRPVLFGYRQVSSSVSRDIEVRLTPPQLGVLSSFHFINYGGSEMVVYRVSPADAQTGVRVGDNEYAGYPATGAGIPSADPGLRVAFFGLLWNQDENTPIRVFARDSLGNQSEASFDFRVFPKKFRDSRIEVDDRFLSRVVPAILQNTPELKVANPGDLLESFLSINRDLRKQNNEKIAALARSSEPQVLWQGPFKQLSNTAVEAGFADARTYVYKGKAVDQQTHLGFDLASNSAAPVEAANRGKVVFADYLGIYGNCVILDHGMGLQSLYAHLSSIEVKIGDTVAAKQSLGRTGVTGLAGGDHLHFTMLLGGNPVTAVDWWSDKWIADRITRKLRDAGAAPAPAG